MLGWQPSEEWQATLWWSHIPYADGHLISKCSSSHVYIMLTAPPSLNIIFQDQQKMKKAMSNDMQAFWKTSIFLLASLSLLAEVGLCEMSSWSNPCSGFCDKNTICISRPVGKHAVCHEGEDLMVGASRMQLVTLHRRSGSREGCKCSTSPLHSYSRAGTPEQCCP